MIFPNRPPAPEMRPGMGYTPGANRFGYVAHMGYTPGASTLGDFSASEENAAVDAGIAPSDIDLLNNLGATDQDLQNLINGNVTLQQLYAQYGVSIPAGATTAVGTSALPLAPPSSVVPSVTPAATPGTTPATAQVPPGSTILYTAQYNPVSGWTTSAGAIGALSPLLPAHGMSLLSSSVSASGLVSNASFSVTILDSIGNNLLTDAKSVLDALMNQITNNGLQQSTLTVVSQGTTASGASPAPIGAAMDFATWVENNAMYIGAAVAALFALNIVMGGKRR